MLSPQECCDGIITEVGHWGEDGRGVFSPVLTRLEGTKYPVCPEDVLTPAAAVPLSFQFIQSLSGSSHRQQTP